MAAVAVGIVVISTIVSAFKSNVSVEPLSSPKSMSEAGLTANVAALRLRDAIKRVAEQAQSGEKLPEILPEAELPDIVVPGVGVSVQTLATEIATFLGIKSHHKITGEFTTREGQIFVNLRFDGKLFFLNKKNFAENQIDDLMIEAARESLKMIQPKDFAVLMYRNGDDMSVLSVVDSIIAANLQCSSHFWLMMRQTAACHDVVIAHNLKGLVLDRLKRREEAVFEYLKAIELDRNFIWAYVDLGIALEHLEQWEQAIAEYKKAIKLDPKFIEAHTALHSVLMSLGRQEEVISEYKKAIELDPKSIEAHIGLGSVLGDLGRQEEAIKEYKKAIELGPKNAAVHNRLGNVLADLGQREEALAEFRAANALDPKFEIPSKISSSTKP